MLFTEGTPSKKETLIFSELLLGACEDAASAHLRTLIETRFKLPDGSYSLDRIVSLGNLVAESWSRLTKTDWALLNFLKKIAAKPDGPKIILVRGDREKAEESDPLSQLGTLMGATVTDTHEWKVGDKECLAVYGHLFRGGQEEILQYASEKKKDCVFFASRYNTSHLLAGALPSLACAVGPFRDDLDLIYLMVNSKGLVELSTV